MIKSPRMSSKTRFPKTKSLFEKVSPSSSSFEDVGMKKNAYIKFYDSSQRNSNRPINCVLNE